MEVSDLIKSEFNEQEVVVYAVDGAWKAAVTIQEDDTPSGKQYAVNRYWQVGTTVMWSQDYRGMSFSEAAKKVASAVSINS